MDPGCAPAHSCVLWSNFSGFTLSVREVGIIIIPTHEPAGAFQTVRQVTCFTRRLAHSRHSVTVCGRHRYKCDHRPYYPYILMMAGSDLDSSEGVQGGVRGCESGPLSPLWVDPRPPGQKSRTHRRNSSVLLLLLAFVPLPHFSTGAYCPEHPSPSSPTLLFCFSSLQFFLLPFSPQNPKW